MSGDDEENGLYQGRKRLPKYLDKDENEQESADEAETLELRQEIAVGHGPRHWQERLDDLRAVKRRKRDHIKESQQDVDVDDVGGQTHEGRSESQEVGKADHNSEYERDQ